jgi:hypothetical protein
MASATAASMVWEDVVMGRTSALERSSAEAILLVKSSLSLGRRLTKSPVLAQWSRNLILKRRPSKSWRLHVEKGPVLATTKPRRSLG